MTDNRDADPEHSLAHARTHRGQGKIFSHLSFDFRQGSQLTALDIFTFLRPLSAPPLPLPPRLLLMLAQVGPSRVAGAPLLPHVPWRSPTGPTINPVLGLGGCERVSVR